MKKIIYALRFMTVIPIKWKENEDMGDVARSISFFPIVGFIIGLSNYGIFRLSDSVFSPLLTSIILIVWWIFITGGLHLDGLADTADGVWGGTSKERRLEIMKDSRTGVFGVLTLISFLLLKIGVLNELFTTEPDLTFSLVISAPVIGRWISVFSIYFFPTARKDGLGHFFKENITVKELVLSLVMTSIMIFFLSGIKGLISLVIITILSLAGALFFKSKLGGLTGDIYGSLCETAELLTLLVLLVI